MKATTAKALPKVREALAKLKDTKPERNPGKKEAQLLPYKADILELYFAGKTSASAIATALTAEFGSEITKENVAYFVTKHGPKGAPKRRLDGNSTVVNTEPPSVAFVKSAPVADAPSAAPAASAPAQAPTPAPVATPVVAPSQPIAPPAPAAAQAPLPPSNVGSRQRFAT